MSGDMIYGSDEAQEPPKLKIIREPYSTDFEEKVNKYFSLGYSLHTEVTYSGVNWIVIMTKGVL